MIGCTCYEFQWGRLGVRILRPMFYFTPYRDVAGATVWPRYISFYLAAKENA